MENRKISISGFPPAYSKLKLKLFMENHIGKDSVEEVEKKEDYVVFTFNEIQGVQGYLQNEVTEMTFGGQNYPLRMVNKVEEMAPDDVDHFYAVKTDDEKTRKGIYVTNIPTYLHVHNAFRFHFERFGRVQRCFLHNECRYGIIEYFRHEDARRAKDVGRAAGPNAFMSIEWSKSKAKPRPNQNEDCRQQNRSSRVDSSNITPEQVQPTFTQAPTFTQVSLDIIHYWSSFGRLPEAEGTRCLLVQNIDPSTHVPNIKMHFENKKRSNGGPVLTVVSMIDGLLVVFKDGDDCESCLAKTDQQFNGNDINIYPKMIPTYCDNRIVITGVDASTSVDTLELYLESCSKDETSPISCEKQALPGVYLIDYGDNYDPAETDSLLKQISTEPLENRKLKAQRLLMTDCLKVLGVPSDVSNDAIKLQFTSKKRTDGGPVTRIDRLKSDAALVYFALYIDAERVYRKFKDSPTEPLLIQKYPVTLQLYFHCLSNEHENVLKELPTPVPRKVSETPASKGTLTTFRYEFQKDDPRVMKFIQENKEHYDKLKACFSNIAKVAFASMSDFTTGAPTTFLTFTPLKKKGYLSLDQTEFNDECQKRLKDFLSNYETEEQKFDKSKLAKARALKLFPELDRNYNGKVDNCEANIFWGKDGSVVHISGSKQSIDPVLEHINNCLDCSVSNMAINEGQYRVLTSCGIIDELKQKYQKVTIQDDPKQQSITLTGLQSDISLVQIDALTVLTTVEKKKLSGLEHCIITFLSETLKLSPEMKNIIQQEFEKKKVKAIVRMDGDEPCIQTRTDNDFRKAIRILKDLILTDSIEIDEATSTILSSPTWKGFQQNLLGAWSYRIYIKPNDCILMVSLAVELQPLRRKIEHFLDENVIKPVVFVMPYGCARFTVEKSKKFSEENCKKNSIECSLTSDSGGGVLIKGKKRGLQTATTEMQNLVSNIDEAKHTLRYPGMKDYFKGEYGSTFLKTTEIVNNCIILMSSRDCEEWIRANRQRRPNIAIKGATAAPQPTARGHRYASVKLPRSSVTVSVWKIDIIKHKCDVIVNASNPELLLLAGGVSGVIKTLDAKNGNKIQLEMTAVIRSNHGDVLPGDAHITTAGNLPSCKKIVHAVGPRWNSPSARGDPKSILKACVFKSLEAVDNARLKSIAIPAISCGIFGGKIDVCIPLIMETVVEYSRETLNSTLKQVDFVELSNQQVLDEFVKNVNEYKPKNPVKSTPMVVNPQPAAVFTQNMGMNVALQVGNIQDQAADVIVNVSPPESFINMQGSAVSKAILSKAGGNVLAECSQNPGPHNLGDVVETSGGGLSCQRLYHAIVSHYKPKYAEAIIKSVVSKSLQSADAAGHRSIAFPAIATGGFKYPANLVAQWMRKYISSFSGQNLQNIVIVLYPNNGSVIQAFNAEFRNSTSTSGQQTTPNSSSTFFHQKINSSSARFGPYTLSVYKGDITEEKSDAIVNSTNSKFDLSQGMVAKAIVQNGGAVIQTEVNAANGNDVRVTSGGSLACRNIIHIVTPNSNNQIQNRLLDILSEVENQQLSSVSIPALATGNLGLSASDVACIMRKAFERYAKSNPSPAYLNSINVVVFEKKMLHDFKDVLLNNQVGFLARLRDTVINWFSPNASTSSRQEETLDLYFYSDKEEDISKAIKSITHETEKMTQSQVITDDAIGRISDWELFEIKEIGIQNHVNVTDRSNKYLKQYTIEGLTTNVMKAHEAIKDILKDYSTAEASSSYVKWQRLTSNGTWVDYPARAVHILEKAYKAKNLNPTDTSLSIVKVPGFHEGVVTEYKVDLNSLGQANPTISRKLKESEKSADAVPSHWQPIPQGHPFLKVTLAPGTQEYITVLGLFNGVGVNAFMPNTIHSIEKIQNESLYKQYMAKKNEVTSKLAKKGIPVTRQLFHGTSDDDKILLHGFDRSYAGKNATAHGRGVYFATNASYSNGYAAPNNLGQRRMFVADVVTGEFCQGHPSYVAPPAKPGSTIKNDLYDSVVNNINTPSIFVIFKDASAYPTYLITYQ